MVHSRALLRQYNIPVSLFVLGSLVVCTLRHEPYFAFVDQYFSLAFDLKNLRAAELHPIIPTSYKQLHSLPVHFAYVHCFVSQNELN